MQKLISTDFLTELIIEQNKLYYMRVVNMNRTSFIECNKDEQNKLCDVLQT